MQKTTYTCNGCGKETTSSPAVSINIYGVTPTVQGHACNEVCLREALLVQINSVEKLTYGAVAAKRDARDKTHAGLDKSQLELAARGKEVNEAMAKLGRELETIFTVRSLLKWVLRR